MSQDVLVINSGSSSIKYQLVDVATGELRVNGRPVQVTYKD